MKFCPACNHQNPDDAISCGSCGDRLVISSDLQKTIIRGTQPEAFAPGYLVADRYEILKEIGRGGMGVVYRVKDTRLLNREMALKMIHPQIVELAEARQRFEQEVNTCLDLLHPNIVRVHNLEELEGLQFFTMEYITGRNLQELIAERRSKKPPFTLFEIEAIIAPVLDALSYAHQFTIHRDIKPDNIIVIGDFPNVSVKVLDFGIAKTLTTSRFTQTAQVLGTAFYMAPEQMSGGEIDHRADLYSMGMIVYEMLTGKMAVGRFRLPGEIYTGLPKELDEMLEKALASAPEQRFQDAAAMHRALQNAVSISVAEIKVKTEAGTPGAATVTERGPQPIQAEMGAAKPAAAAGTRRKILPWVYVCSVLLTVLLAAGVFFNSRKPGPAVPFHSEATNEISSFNEMQRLLEELPQFVSLKDGLPAYYIHVWPFTMPLWDNKREAQELLSELHKKIDPNVQINSAPHARSMKYTVFYGPYSSKLEAARMAKKLKDAGYSFFIKLTANA